MEETGACGAGQRRVAAASRRAGSCLRCLVAVLMVCAAAGDSDGLREHLANEWNLRQQLLDGYNRFDSPRDARAYLQLYLSQLIKVDTAAQTWKIGGWWRTTWQDSRLAWDAERWNIDSMAFTEDEIWRVDEYVYEALRESTSGKTTLMHVYPDGVSPALRALAPHPTPSSTSSECASRNGSRLRSTVSNPHTMTPPPPRGLSRHGERDAAASAHVGLSHESQRISVRHASLQLYRWLHWPQVIFIHSPLPQPARARTHTHTHTHTIYKHSIEMLDILPKPIADPGTWWTDDDPASVLHNRSGYSLLDDFFGGGWTKKQIHT